MPDPTPPAPAPPTGQPTAAGYDAQLPGWQQRLNLTCENWIFAFLVAMAIRHFALEAFRIPTASMEPMLYGDPAFLKGDNVLVDKLFFKITGPKRWDVTVFQYPVPEIEGEGDAYPAIDFTGKRVDMVLLRPLMYRNFVKRTVILPGETFYISGGDIYLKQADGSFAVARKPPAVQEALWQEVYRHGAQSNYLPWQGDDAASVASDGDHLTYTFHNGGTMSFIQPLRNLYLKPGIFKVRPALPDDDNPNAPEYPVSDNLYENVDLSMTRPQFVYRPNGRTGNAWNMDQWAIRRLNSAELDSGSNGVLLNRTMREYIGDVRFRATITKLEGSATLEIAQGGAHSYQLILAASGWSVIGDGKTLKSGNDPLIGQEITFTHLDNQIIFAIAGVELLRTDVAAVDPNIQRLALRWHGAGSLTLSSISLCRDVHYTSTMRGSFLCDDTQQVAQLDSRMRDPLNASSSQLDREAAMLRMIESVHAQMLHIDVQDLSEKQRTQRLGYSPETAITAPQGAYLMLGDNSPQSLDSRCWGWVPAENLRGRVLAVILPPNRWRLVR
jgi:signal peptidase I/type IV secretory pathway protease TraF